MTNYEIGMLLVVVACIISGRLGWVLAMDYWNNKLTKEIRAEIYEEFKKDYFDRFVVLFEEKVEIRSKEIAEEILKEKEKCKNESSGSN